jgi:hypothetical protein
MTEKAPLLPEQTKDQCKCLGRDEWLTMNGLFATRLGAPPATMIKKGENLSNRR